MYGLECFRLASSRPCAGTHALSAAPPILWKYLAATLVWIAASATSGTFAQDRPAAAPSLRDLIEALDPDNPSRVRHDAVRALAGLGEAAQPALPHLLGLFDDDDTRVRQVAAWSIAQIGFADEPSIIRDLLERARTHPDEEVRRYALQALARPDATAPREVVDALCAMVREDPSPAIRRQALQTLGAGATLSGAGVELFVELIRDEDHLRVRDAIRALRPGIAIADETLVGLLLDLLFVRRKFDFAPGERVPAGATGELRVGTRLRLIVGHAVGPAGRDVVQSFLAIGYVGRAFLGTLMRLAPAHFDLFLDALRTGGPPQDLVLLGLALTERREILEWMDPAVVPELVRLFHTTVKSEDPPERRYRVFRALCRVVHVGDPGYVAPEAVPLLLHAFRSHDEPNWLRAHAATAIRWIGPAAAHAALPILLEHLPALQDESEEAALRALGALGDPRAIPALEQALVGRPARLRAALRAIRDLGPAAAGSVVRIVPLLQHPYPWVGLEAVATLKSMGPAAAEAAGPLADLVTGEQNPRDLDKSLPAHATEALEAILGEDNARDLLARQRGGAKKKTQVTDPASPR